MNKRGNVGMFVILFVGVIVALALFSPIMNTTSQMTSKQTTTNKSIDVSSAYVNDNTVNESINFTIYTQSAWKQSDCPLTSVVIRNGAGTTLTLNTDYKLYASQGVFSLVNTTKTVPQTSLNLTYVDYTYCADGYLTDASSRSIAKLVVLFSALAILAFVLERSGVVSFGGLRR